MPVAKTTHFEVRRFLAQIIRYRLPTQEARRFLYGLRAFYDFLLLGGVVDSSVPRFIIPRSRFRDRVPRVLSESEMRLLIRSAPTARDRAIIEVMYATGCRLGELVNIRLEDIDFSRRSIKLRGKAGPRMTFFGRHAEAAIRRYLEIRGTFPGNLFLSHPKHQLGCVVLNNQNHWVGWWLDYSTGHPKRKVIYLGTKKNMSRKVATAQFRALFSRLHTQCPSKPSPLRQAGVQRIFELASIRAGLAKVTPHTIRHTCATHLLLRGANLRQIQEWLGHAWIGTTQIYTHVQRSNVEDAFHRFHPRR